LVVGPNGQGKTNLLEAVYLLATLRPLRAGRYAELIRFGCQEGRVSGRFAWGGAQRTIAVQLDEGGREAFVDGKRAASLSDYFGGVSVVAFTPDDLSVIKGGPEARRRLLDRAVFNRFPGHLEACREYQRALRQRNRLLREGADPELLDSYAEELAKTGARVVVQRSALVSELSVRVRDAFEAIARGDAGLELRYAPRAIPEEALASEPAACRSLLDALRRYSARDVERGFTSTGPHADDLEITLSGRPARTFASQGQQRACVLALRVGEIENLRGALGRPPLLLLDDVSSELDPARNAFLMEYLRSSGLQFFLTTTDERLVCQAGGLETLKLEVSRGVFRKAP
jgi:DNA replication and repair protein RecF